MKKIRVISISLAPYSRTLWLMANCPQEDYVAWCKKHFGVELNIERCNGRHSSFEKGTYIGHTIWMERYRGRVDEVALLAHEVYHATMSVWREVKTEVSETTEELFAAFQQMLLVSAMAELKKGKSCQRK